MTAWDDGPPTDIHTRRLLASVYPTRLEEVVLAGVGWCYRLGETGPTGWVGDRLDRWVVASQRRRADQHRHLSEYQRHRNR